MSHECGARMQNQGTLLQKEVNPPNMIPSYWTAYPVVPKNGEIGGLAANYKLAESIPDTLVHVLI